MRIFIIKNLNSAEPPINMDDIVGNITRCPGLIKLTIDLRYFITVLYFFELGQIQYLISPH